MPNKLQEVPALTESREQWSFFSFVPLPYYGIESSTHLRLRLRGGLRRECGLQMTEISETVLPFCMQETQVFFMEHAVGFPQGNQIETLYVSEPAERPLVQAEVTP